MEKALTFQEILDKMSEIHSKKNADYGDSFGDTYNKYGFVSALVRLSDKLNRLNSLYRSGNIQVKDESIEDTLLDLANYAVMTLERYSQDVHSQEEHPIPASQRVYHDECPATAKIV